jgi:hypothetical protein
MTPRQRPVPELPTRRPLPLACDRPTDTLTETIPVRLMPPVTLPPPAEDTRVPVTVKGTLLVELQLPAWVAKATFQIPSYAPARATLATLASAVWGTVAAARTAAANTHREARMAVESADKAIDRAEIGIFPSFRAMALMASARMSKDEGPRFSVAR